MQDRRRWYPVWRCHVQDYAPIGASASDLTQQMTFRNNLDGESIRIRLSNLYGKEPLPISDLQVTVSEKKINFFTDKKADAANWRPSGMETDLRLRRRARPSVWNWKKKGTVFWEGCPFPWAMNPAGKTTTWP